MGKLLMVAIGALLAVSPGVAQDTDCADPQDQVSLNICAGEAYKAADDQLNQTYKALAATLSDEGVRKLKTAQRAWISYRDAQCAFDTAGTEGGSIHPMVYAMCLDELTQAQTEQLARQLECEEGDVSCGSQ